jgi:CRP/FNR family transcriptional regulator, anaerobic regulatory protein
MAAQLQLRTIEARAVPNQLACAACPALALNVCQAASEAPWAKSTTNRAPVRQFAHFAPARRIICHDHDMHDAVPIICGGWAASIAMLSDSSRQILSFLLPGDVILAALMVEPRSHYVIESITDVHYRIFSRAELKAMFFNQPSLIDKLTETWVEEKIRVDQLIVDLGRRTADERIARLILSLVERLAKRGMSGGDPIELDFPLRQHHIADAVGLTPVHVSKVLSDFRRKALIKISERSLTILDLAAFRRIAYTR